MIKRIFTSELLERLEQFPAVALLGPRQVGKTTLALEIQNRLKIKGIYLDLESAQDRKKLEDPVQYFSDNSDALIILDEVQRTPDIFSSLRGTIDSNRRKGRKTKQFLLLGSASRLLLQQSSESLAGRISYMELPPITPLEINKSDINKLWLRGGFPESFLAATDRQSRFWREEFIQTYIERDIPILGPRIPSETLRRLLTMLAHLQGTSLNLAQLGRNLALDGKTISRYIDILTDLFLIRRLEPYHANVSKRLVRAPKLYLRDSGILHSLLAISDHDELLTHPIVGASWEGLVLETLLSVKSNNVAASFYRTSTGVEMDLVLEKGKDLWAVEIKKNLAPSLKKGFQQACDDLKPNRTFVVYPGNDTYSIGKNIEVISLQSLAKLLAAWE